MEVAPYYGEDLISNTSYGAVVTTKSIYVPSLTFSKLAIILLYCVLTCENIIHGTLMPKLLKNNFICRHADYTLLSKEAI